MAITVPHLPEEALAHVFWFSDPKDNAKINSFVCRNWRRVAGEVVKKQIHKACLGETKAKAANFLKLASAKTLEPFCPAYRKFAAMNNDEINSYTVSGILQAHRNLCTVHTLSLSQFFRVPPEDVHIPKEHMAHVSGKAFAELHYYYAENRPAMWSDKAVTYLPIELFSLALTGEEQAVTIKQNEGAVCFPLRGRLIEIRLTAGDTDLHEAKFTGFPAMNRQTAVDIVLTDPNATEGKIWPQMLYIHTRDAMPDEPEPHQMRAKVSLSS